MAKSYERDAEERAFLFAPAEAADSNEKRRGEREDTAPMGGARFIALERIKPDPGQPRKTFAPETLASLAESIRELGEIIDPLTVEYDETHDVFRIISGERRYRAAKLVGLEKLPCIIKEVDEKKRALLQLIANLQRQDMTPLEESAGIRALAQKSGYSQATLARLLNRSESYISQILGLERLSESARAILQTSEVSREIQIRASREKDPARQEEMLRDAAEQGKTVRRIRAEAEAPGKHKINGSSNEPAGQETQGGASGETRKFKKWSWRPQDGRCEVNIRFRHEHPESQRMPIIRAALREALIHLTESVAAGSPGGERNLYGIRDEQK